MVAVWVCVLVLALLWIFSFSRLLRLERAYRSHRAFVLAYLENLQLVAIRRLAMDAGVDASGTFEEVVARIRTKVAQTKQELQ